LRQIRIPDCRPHDEGWFVEREATKSRGLRRRYVPPGVEAVFMVRHNRQKLPAIIALPSTVCRPRDIHSYLILRWKEVSAPAQYPPLRRSPFHARLHLSPRDRAAPDRRTDRVPVSAPFHPEFGIRSHACNGVASAASCAPSRCAVSAGVRHRHWARRSRPGCTG